MSLPGPAPSGQTGGAGENTILEGHGIRPQPFTRLLAADLEGPGGGFQDRAAGPPQLPQLWEQFEI